MYQRQGKTAYKASLTGIQRLSDHLKKPHQKFKTIHVAGTNGKGSTCHLLASVLQEAGYTVGLYTSPHLKDFRERIRINGKPVSKQYVIGFVNKHRTYFEREEASFFEMTVGMAFSYFAYKKVDVAIIEVGLGGRLDATNIILPELSVITNIGLDHTQFLGDTLAAIAQEKAGIIKPKVPVIIGEYHKETASVFEQVAKTQNSPLMLAYNKTVKELPSDLKGSYQKHNKKTTQVALQWLVRNGWKITNNQLAKGMLNVVRNTGLTGRWQVLQESPKIICDTAHNSEGLSYVLSQLLKEPFENLHMVIGTVTGKNLSTILSLFPKEAHYYYCKPNVPRGKAAHLLKKEGEIYGLKGEVYTSVSQAFNQVKAKASTKDLIFIGGSTFVVAEVL